MLSFRRPASCRNQKSMSHYRWFTGNQFYFSLFRGQFSVFRYHWRPSGVRVQISIVSIASVSTAEVCNLQMAILCGWFHSRSCHFHTQTDRTAYPGSCSFLLNLLISVLLHSMYLQVMRWFPPPQQHEQRQKPPRPSYATHPTSQSGHVG